MSFFNWFLTKPRQFKSDATSGVGSSPASPEQPALTSTLPDRPAPGSLQTVEDRRIRRHARREQLYVAVREAMTRSGVLSASYKFKVLSLDQIGNEFLVMVDLSMAFDGITGRLGAMEALISRQAKARFGIIVPTVYWRMDTLAPQVAANPLPPPPSARPLSVSVLPDATPTSLRPATRPVIPGGPAPIRRDPIDANEVEAFQNALLSASAKGPTVVEAPGKTRLGPHSYTLLTGFEDTELPESGASPALSRTQYGELT